jgi:hypothetical protein
VLLPAQNRKDVKDLPQEVKDGLEIVHVRYVSPEVENTVKRRQQKYGTGVVADFGAITATSGRPFATSGPTPSGPASRNMPAFRAGCEMDRS